MSLERGAILNNRYRILEILGQGGMGAVYRAQDQNLGVEVAVKENLFLTDEYARQFRREANILASLRHPNLPRVGDHFVLDNQGQYLVMDYIEGEDLRQRMERIGILPEDEVILMGAAICEALAYLHSRKPPIVHRDIKPGNVKITPDGQIVLVDFGLAKIMEGSQDTTTGARAMTPGYSPPEQYGTARTDPRTDIYSLGATLYAALSGVIPEDGLARATGSAELTSLRKISPKVNRRLASVIEKALEVRPEDRYQTAEEFREALLDASPATRQITPGDFAVQPPPPEVVANNENGQREILPPLPNASSPIRPSRPSYPLARRRKSSWARVVILLLLITIVSGGGAIFYFQLPVAMNLLAIAQSMTSTSSTVTTQETQTPTQPLPSNTPEIFSSPTNSVPILLPSNTPTIPFLEPSLTPTFGPSPTPTLRPTPLGGVYGEIAFASDRSGKPQIWRMDSDGGDLFQITHMPDGACQPSWSPDGTQLVFISPCLRKMDVYEGSSLYIIDRNGNNLKALPKAPEGDFDPAWSPDGKDIAFTSLREGRTQIYLLNLEKVALSVLSNTRYADKQPSWSPDGSEIVFVRTKYTDQIWLVSRSGQVSDQFSRSGNKNDQHPVWSPDGEFIYFLQNSPENLVLGLAGMRYADRDTTTQFRITVENTIDVSPVSGISVSPDGNWFAFESWPDGKNHDIYRMTIQGTDLIRLTADPGMDFGPVWRPNAH